METASAPAVDGVDALSPASHNDVKPTTEPVPTSKPTNALTPPTSEEMNMDAMKQEEESELSELDLDDDEEEEEIEPDHYWDGENGGRIPVFKPTMEQFRSFKKFVDKIDKHGMKSGIVKVIPPKEWRDNLPALQEHVKHIKIKNPITQEFNGSYGEYTQQNVEKQRSYNLPEWKGLCEETQHQPPAKRGERRRNQEKTVRSGGRARGRAAAVKEEDGEVKALSKSGRGKRGAAAGAAESGDDSKGSRCRSRGNVPATPESPATNPAKAEKKKPGRKPGGGQAKSVSSRRLNNTTETVDYVDEATFQDFDYHMDGLEEFTPERCAELESHYWKSLSFNQPMYAADMPGSLFDDRVTSWNVAKLENLLDVLGTKVPGVNTAYLYMGMWKATFAWHLEDVDLYSINYIHFGAPKQWYSISQEDARRFEAAMKNIWPVDAKNCDQFLRHKTYLISPDKLLKDYNVKVNKLVHYEGEFVITYPYGYHSGFNLGYNCAESVNFATESWLDYGRIARKCNCEADNVWVDVAEIERKLRGEPTPEYYEETDDEDELDEEEDGNLPSPPASVKGPKTQSKKRKRDVKQEAPKKKKKIRIRIKAPTREPCVLCPNDTAHEPLLPTDNGKKAHRSCALFTPETWITVEDGNEKVHGVTTIDRARLELKCNFCRSKRGACFQCSSKKCTRAFHATCALAAGVQVDCGPVPTFGEDGTEYFETGYDFRCKFHRPKMPKNVNIEVLENSKRINTYAKEVKAGDVVQAQYVGGEVFAGLVIENRPSELTFLVDVLPEGDRVEVDWKWLCVLNEHDSLRPKPSASAVPMPEGMSKKAVSIENRQDGVPTQDQPFHDNPDYKWREFINMDMPPPGYARAKLERLRKSEVNLSAADQLYYYLPEMSTEARSFFTDTQGGKTHVAKSNFLDRVTPRPVYQPPSHRAVPATPTYPGMSSHRVVNPAALSNLGRSGEKPYVYKPKKPAQPNMVAVDHQALANQRNFTANGVKQSSPVAPQAQQQGGAYYDPARNSTTPLRAFPPDQYYSTKTLPAAYPGDYSQYQSEVRRQSQGSSTITRPSSQCSSHAPNYQQVADQRAQIKRNSDIITQQRGSSGHVVRGGFAGNPGSRPVTAMGEADTRRPSSSSHGQQSPAGAPLTPATTVSSTYKSSEDLAPGFAESLRKYPYLLQSFCRKPQVYESPYPIGGGFSAAWQPYGMPGNSDQKQSAYQSPYSSTTPHHDASRSGTQQWTPPSQIYQATNPPAPPKENSPQVPQPLPRSLYPQPVYQTAQDFQQSLQREPSVASREGKHQRMLRDLQSMGQGPPQYFPPSSYSTPLQPQLHYAQQQYDQAKMWSPKAPTPSPLSDRNVPYTHHSGSDHPQGDGGWGQLPRTDVAPMQGQQLAGSAGYGPALPQMGNETWRYN